MSPSMRRHGAIALLMAAGLVAIIARRPDVIREPYLWAEDGTVYLQDALNHGWSLWDAYAGQLRLLERVVMFPISSLPLTLIPRVTFIVGIAIVVLALSVVLQARLRTFFGRFRFQVLAFALLVFLPGTFEASNGILSIYLWLPLSVSLVVAAGAPRTAWGRGAEMTYLVVTGLTSLTAVAVLPVAAWMALWERSNRRRRVNLGVMGVLAAVEIVVMAASRRPAGGAASPLDYPLLLVKKAAGVLLIGDANLGSLWREDTRLILGAMAALLMAMLIYVAAASPRGPGVPLLASGALYAALGIYSLNVVTPIYWQTNNGRYFVPLLAAMVVVATMALGTGTGHIRWIAGLALVATSFGVASDAYLPKVRGLDPVALQEFADCVENGTTICTMDVEPYPYWQIRVDPVDAR